ncbi:NADH-ubiquinone oxidoreductase-F iron-sulfur binding region domain-containing protein [Symbioplanes lichenis]|uniref:NADH-ubiquinone oxidoreductase-F iron-sulfur binding region domain-containing protein n=1 Tax=Symbioplanes lichenis TaxID=1629072 RepID=UPI002739428B|nr:NADH-ubiquinone oxidoreductase-F iron-sulfur binding region domain-containing protein [Actinoplanes lichenis]
MITMERRLLAGDDSPFAQPTATQLVALLREAGLTGRGGAGFPAWRKLEAVADAGRPPVVVGNGAEGEPLSGKDRALLTYQPQLVLDGLRIVARALGATATHLYVHPALRALTVGIPMTVAPDAFVAGEESAVVNALAGRAPVPSDKRIRITQAGLGGAPTLVQNVETLAHIALIVRHGPQWFRSAGTPDEPGTFLATVGGAVAAPGVVEAGYGVRLGDLVDAAGGPVQPVQAVLVGGYHGGWVPAWPELPVSRAALGAYGSSPGAGVVLALPSSACGLAETASIAGCLAGQVAGQCGPCVNGLPRIATTLADLAARRARPGLVDEVTRLSALVQGRGACRHPDGTVRLVRSAMRAFAADVTAHLHGECLAGGAR